MAIELGRTPRRDEFTYSLKGGDYKLRTLFGDYETLVLAAGLNLNKGKKITNEIFEKDISKHLSKMKPRKIKTQELPTIASISDIHWPFSNDRVIKRFLEYVGDEKPKYIILNGDAHDMYSHMKFPRSHNLFTPREETNKARSMNEKFWAEILKRSKDSKNYQLIGNHDLRPLKRILESYPEAEDWIQEKLNQIFTFKGVTTIYDPREELILNNIAIFHGYKTKLGDHRDYTLMNCINGHTHRGGVAYRQLRGEVLWELNCGFAGDPESKGLSYTPQKITNWTPGFGAVDALGPRFIPL